MKIIRIGLVLVLFASIVGCDKQSVPHQSGAQLEGQSYENNGFQITLPETWTIWVDKEWPEGYTQVVAQSDNGISLYLDIYDMSERENIPTLGEKMKKTLSFLVDEDERNSSEFEVGVADFGFSKGMFTHAVTPNKDFYLEGYLHEGERYAAFLLFETPAQYHTGFEDTAASIYKSISYVESGKTH